MDLQDFVTTTLCQISAGVATAKNYDRCVAPRLDVGERDPKILRTFAGADGVFLVEFDVAVTISDASEKEPLPVSWSYRRQHQSQRPKVASKIRQ
jgi:hypothetical protein